MKAAAGITRTHNPFGEVRRASCLRENLTSSSYGEGLETGRAISSGTGPVPYPTAVLQMDQGASADQVLLRDFGQRSEDSGLGGHHRLPSRRHCKETPEIATKSPYATSNRGSEPVRENRYHSTGYEGIKARNHGRNR